MLKISNALKSIYAEHKILYTIGLLLIFTGSLLYPFIPYIRFMLFFSVFCGSCCIIYGLLCRLEKCLYDTVRIIAKICRVSALILICIFTVSFITVQALIIDGMKENESECEYIIVLGGGVNGTKPSAALACRLDRAEKYLNDYPESTAILCGGQGSGELITEAQAMETYLLSRGIDKKRLIKEEHSTDTRENIGNAINIIRSTGNSGIPSTAIVSNGFHLYRTKLIAKKQGIDTPVMLNAKMPPIPALIVNLHLREYFSVIFEYMNL